MMSNMSILERMKGLPFLRNYFPAEGTLKQKVSGTLFLIGAILSSLGFLLGVIYALPLHLNLPNFIVMVLCLTIPAVFTGSLPPAIFMLHLAAYAYFPFLYFTNAGFSGTVPFYFFMMFLYNAFFFEGKKLLLHFSLLLSFYTAVIWFSLLHPEYVIPYPDELSGIIDRLVGFFSMTAVISIMTSMAYKEYKRERIHAVATAEELSRQNLLLETALITDQLTGIYTRQFFLEQFERECEASTVKGLVFYVMMIDIDHFKHVNDTYGHLIGDEMLKLIGKTIQKSIREHDIAARYGGEEFIVLISHNSRDTGEDIAERIRKNVEEISYRDITPVTVSIGVTTSRGFSERDEIISKADTLLYAAKQQGRNQVVSNP